MLLKKNGKTTNREKGTNEKLLMFVRNDSNPLGTCGVFSGNIYKILISYTDL